MLDIWSMDMRPAAASRSSRPAGMPMA